MSTAAVFLSYASQDADAAKRICEALRAVGVEVWFDQNELVGGDAWDAKIRGQISSCALFVPVISAATQARGEGYFRLEWKLAVDRSHLMAHDQPFLLPVVIDATKDGEARVPPEFRAVQWTRLPGGETPAAFCARVKKLLGGDAAGSEVGARPVSAQGDGLGPATPRQKPSRPWLAPAILGVAAVAALALWQPWRAKEKPAAPVSPAAAVTPAAPLTEAQQLVAKARKILDEGDEMNRETYTLAEDLLKKAEALDVTEASAWALHAQVSSDLLLFGLDYSAARLEAVRAQASRAVKLAPDSLEAALAVAQAQTRAGQDPDGVLQRMQALAEKYPNDWRVWRTLGRAAQLAIKMDLGLDAVNRALQLLPDDPRLKSDRVNLLERAARFPEAESAEVRALEGRQSARLVTFEVLLKLTWRGDLAGATAAVRRLPEWYLSEDRGSAIAGLAYLWAREPKKALEIVSRFPRDYIRSSDFYGPRAVLTAWAHELAGESESAKADWQIVIQLADRELSVVPDDGAALHWKAWALARLGKTDEADRLLRLLRERNFSVTLGRGRLESLLGNLAGLAAAVGRPDLAIEQLDNALNGKLLYRGRAAIVITKNTLRLNPVFDPLRGDPRFQVLIEAAPGPEEKKENTSASGAAALDPKSVAVLAFANMSAEKDNEYFSDGLSEEILDKLARNPALRVMARTSSFSYKGKNVPIPQIGRELNVGTIIEGSVRRAGNQLRITAQLINAADGTHIWSETYDKELTTAGIFAIQDEIAQKIAARLAPAGTPAAPAVATAPTQNLAAYEAYLRGRSFQMRSSALKDDAVREFQRAVSLDPQFALAWAQLAGALGGSNIFNASGADWRLAMRALDEARRLAGDIFETHLAAAQLNYVQMRYDLVGQELAQAERLRPRNAWVVSLRGQMEINRGNWNEGIDLLRQATELDPQDGSRQSLLGNQLRLVGRYAEAEQTLDRAFGMTGGDTQLCVKAIVYFQWEGDAALVVKTLDAVPLGIRSDIYWTYRWNLLRDVGDYKGATAAVDKIRAEASRAGEPKALMIALALESQGDHEGARRAYAEALPIAERYRVENSQGINPSLVVAEIYAGLGRKDEALATAREVLDRVHGIPRFVARIDEVRAQIDARFGMIDDALELAKTQIPTGWWKRNDLLHGANWAELRKDPRFRALAEKAPL